MHCEIVKHVSPSYQWTTIFTMQVSHVWSNCIYTRRLYYHSSVTLHTELWKVYQLYCASTYFWEQSADYCWLTSSTLKSIIWQSGVVCRAAAAVRELLGKPDERLKTWTSFGLVLLNPWLHQDDSQSFYMGTKIQYFNYILFRLMGIVVRPITDLFSALI